ncbi:MAG: bifunctional precorrin-2 dehydrogenase/sirohydrochlorin ferrochelatase [Bacillota bacterium]|nr:bifunctional precorrin-2 dehydrogenase/sirohydrochlorin ferrochelatase [Bacillota bacterium]
MRYLPVSIDTRDKKILVVGGGQVAYRKVKSLLPTEFSIDIVSSSFIDDFKNLQANPRLSFIWKKVDSDFVLDSYDYLLIATDSKTANEILEAKAREKKIPFLNASKSENSDFIMTKLVASEDLTISLSSGGKNPALLGIIAKDLEELIRNIDQEKISALNDLRQKLKDQGEKNIGSIIVDLYKKPLADIKKYGEENCK